MIKKIMLNRKFNIAVKFTALALCTSLVCLEIASINVKAMSVPTEYKNAHGDSNTSNDLYLWRLWKADKGDKDSFYNILSDANKKDKSKPLRVLLAYNSKTEYNDYYIEANWTQTKFAEKGNDKVVAGTYLKAVSTAENAQVLVGNDTFVTRGALRSFVAYDKGQYDGYWGIGYNNQRMYQLCAPNEADDGPAMINNGPVTLCYTYDGTNNGMFFYDGDGNPCGNKEYEATWSNSNYQRSKLKVYDKWILDYAGEQRYMFAACDNGGWNPKLVHSTNDSSFSKMGANNLTVAEHSTVTTIEDEFYCYVGEKIGTTACIGGVNTTCNVEVGTAINKPAYLRSDQTLVVKKGAILFVNNVFEVSGKIENYGTIVVNNNGVILGCADISDTDSHIHCDGGDIIVKSDGYLTIGSLKAENGSELIIETKSPKDNLIVTRGMEITDSIFDYDAEADKNGNRSVAEACVGRVIYGYKGVSQDKDKVLKFSIKQAPPIDRRGSINATFYDKNVVYDD